MNELVQKLKSEGNFIDAYLVAKNNLSRNIANLTCFREFIDLALEIAGYNIVFDERKQYVSDANAALAMFSEAVVIDEDVITIIKMVRSKINEVTKTILEAEQNYFEDVNRKIQDQNTEQLNKLVQIYDTIQSAQTQHDFDVALAKVSDVEAQLQKQAFSKDQAETYEKLTQQYSQAISQKMEAINKNELLAYNKRAIACFNEVFTAFKREPSKYKDESTLKALMTTKFFAFDSSKLFNESLVFYNHVYSLVFQESPDMLKYKLTEWALNTAKLEK